MDQSKESKESKQSLVNLGGDEKGVQMFGGWIKLQPGITKLNYVSSLFHYFAMTFIFVSVESLQPMLFQNRFGIKPQNQGTENGYILLVDILTKCIAAPLIGLMSDKYGRKMILQMGILITGLSMICMGQTQNIYPQYCLARILYAIGAITLATMPLLADYVENDTKGRASAINVVLAGLGAVFSATVITNLLIQNFTMHTSYLTAGVVMIVLGFIYTLGLKKGVYFKEQSNSISSEQHSYEDELIDYDEEIKLLQQVENKSGIKGALQIACLAGRNIWIFQGYITNFLGRGDSILLTLSLVIWSQQYIDDADNDEDRYKQANIKAQTLSGVTYTVIMVFALVYGILLEKISKNVVLFVIFLLTLIGCVLMNFADGPDNPLTFVYMSILGVGMSGLYTAALYLINKYAYVPYRGYITGLANVCSVLGIMTCAFIGGILQDKINNVAPFNLFGLMSLIGLILVVISYFRAKKHMKKYKVEPIQ